MKTLKLEDFKDNTKEWFLEHLSNMSASQVLQTISDLYDELHKPSYPKNYNECCKIIDYHLSEDTIIGYKAPLLRNFQKLFICRDAYLEIAGEQMGLDKPWEPKNELSTRNKIYDIRTYCNNIEKGCTEYPTNRLLSFPTEEMRDAFYENFKDLIENCKELL